MKERLIIKNFGPIKEVDLEIRRFNVIIGDNGTGKSTITKVLAICRYFSYIVSNDVTTAFENGIIDWGLEEAVLRESKIYYECDDYELEAGRVPNSEIDNLDFIGRFWGVKVKNKSERFIALVKAFEKHNPNLENNSSYYDEPNWTPPSSFFENDVKAVMDNPFFLRTERGLQSVFSLGRSGVKNLSDSLFNHLAELDTISKSFKNMFEIDFLNIIYNNENGVSFFYDKDTNERFELKNGPSGYQSSIPIVLAIDYYIRRERRKRTYIIEEPELNLYPKTQNELMKYLVDRTMNYGNKMMITTHSPYCLSSLNNLMYAFELGENESEEVSKIIDKAYWLNPDEVSAYKVMPDGTLKDIFDREEKLIRINEIDEISEELNTVFDKLIDIDHGG